jgi:hypothetical protein
LMSWTCSWHCFAAPAGSTWPLVIALSIAAVCWIGTQTLYVGVRAYEFAQRHRAENPLSTDVLRRTVFTSLARKAAER